MSEKRAGIRDFIRDIIDEDNRNGRFSGKVHTRFPPEPNGQLHIGHAKSICLNFGLAAEYDGVCNLRFDDTNPVKEEDRYEKGIVADVRWLGFNSDEKVYYASDYFSRMYEDALELVRRGKAYVDDLPLEKIREMRGSLTEPGVESPFRERSVEENLDLFQRMKAGEFPNGEKVLRARIDMSSPNMNLRDPVVYRILHSPHHRTGGDWCIYPMYDWAHGLEDSYEGVTHSICTLEFENHRPLYDWFLDSIEAYHPQQIEFARLNLSWTVLSKRRLLQLVEGGHVNGWDDPRMPTLCGMRRRGYPPAAIRDFCGRIGVAKVNSTIAIETFESCVREDLNKTAPRFMGVLRPLKLTISNLDDGFVDELDAVNNPEDPSAGTRKVPFTKHLYIEQTDFMEDAPRKFFRLSVGREVRLRYAYFVTCTDVVKDDDGNVIELICTVDPETRGGDAPDGRKVKGTLHWVSADRAVDTEVRMYDRLFSVEDPGSASDFSSVINPTSLEVLADAKLEPAASSLQIEDRIQLERHGYFCKDRDSTDERPVLNYTIGLRDTWAKMQKK